ncbi:MAG: hypothetical protein EOO23_00875 [Comamonadaceae bacterium]|nr:MAG: hypothetical protein EOO23_00875 [Comamonadaceae bacterium]
MSHLPGAKVCIEFVSADVGGRSVPACLSATYRPHLRVGSGENLGVAFTGSETDAVHAHKCLSAEVAFVYAPQVDYGALVVGAQFLVLEGERVVGVGRVVEVLP